MSSASTHRTRGPIRTCVGCREAGDKRALVRVVLRAGRPQPDPGQVEPGRGAYVHPRISCLANAAKGGFSRSFRTRVGVADSSALAAAVMAAAPISPCPGQPEHTVSEKGK